jgi:small-conductance mechanosensitive channel
LFSVASDLSSLATYFGLLSAGLLLAPQNVILASLGSHVLLEKCGIRVGDRVQVSGITGDVINMGLLQFRLREFDVEEGRFTDHVATFSNSLVFVSFAIDLLKLLLGRLPRLRRTTTEHSGMRRNTGSGAGAKR